MKFGDILEKLIERKGISETDLARELRVTRAYVNMIKRGVQRPPSEKRLLKMARVFGVDPDVLCACGGKVSTKIADKIMEDPASNIVKVKKALWGHGYDGQNQLP